VTDAQPSAREDVHWTFVGQRALVTGAGRGIGRAAALALARAGADVTALARTESELDTLAEEARPLSGRVTVEPADVRDPAELERIVAKSAPDLLVAAAGINRPGPITELNPVDVNDVLEVNIQGTLNACRAFGRRIIEARSAGAVVAVSSQMGAVGYAGRVAYCASKHAVNGLTKALAVEWAPHQIRVNAIAPTFVRTPLTAPMFEDPAFEQEVLDRIPLGRIGEVDDVTGSICFLLSTQAALITGHILAVDGGWTAQ
jgi:NAD(P)-dependent dehydrogenase (short-subunit alcohol dehydrogenase family)